MHKDNIKDKYYLKNGVNITVDTVSIGALQAFEEEFGYLWGIHLKKEELTDGHIAFKKKWDKCRSKILQQAEDSKKISKKNLNKFNVCRKQHFVDFNKED